MARSGEIVGHVTTEELFRQHAGFVARFLTRLGVPSEQLDDALQEVFLVVHRNGGYRPGVAKPTSYLASIAIHAAARHRQRQGTDRKRHSEAVMEEMPSNLEDPAHALQVRQDLHKLQRALATLPEELHAILVLVEIEGESCLSVAAGLGCPVGTIYWRLHEARKRLQSALRFSELPPRKLRPAAVPTEERALPARSLIMLFGFDGFGKSEAARLLHLARERPPAQLPLDALLVRHQQLLSTGAELPAWAANCAPQTTSWLGLLGVGPMAAGFTLGAAAFVVAGLIASSSGQSRPPAQSLGAAARIESLQRAQPGEVAKGSLTQANAAPHLQTARESVANSAATPRSSGVPAIAVARRAVQKASVLDARAGNGGRRSTVITAGPAPSAKSAAPTRAESSARQTPASAQAEDGAGPREDPQLHAPVPGDSAQQKRRAALDAERSEMREIAEAESLLSRDPARALAITRSMRLRFSDGYFREERAYLEVMALAELGRTSELREKASTFLRVYPQGPYSDRVKLALGRDGG